MGRVVSSALPCVVEATLPVSIWDSVGTASFYVLEAFLSLLCFYWSWGYTDDNDIFKKLLHLVAST